MAHCIKAIVGKSELIHSLADDWFYAEAQDLDQGFSLIILSDDLFDDIAELADNEDGDPHDEFEFLSASVKEVMIDKSICGLIAYIEMEYFGGAGQQAAILYEGARVVAGPLFTSDSWDNGAQIMVQRPEGARAINVVLQKLGVRCTTGDEFDSLRLGEIS